MKQPLVSVIIPTYNVAPYIRCAVESVLMQSVPDVEVIVIDDGSTDDTLQVVSRVDDPRVRVISLGSNCGPSVARNVGLQEACGIWVALLDGDDWWATDRLKHLLACATAHDADIVCDDLFYIHDGAKTPHASFLRSLQQSPPQGDTVVDLETFIDVEYSTLQPFIRLDFLRQHGIEHDESGRYCEDFALMVDCLLAGGKLVVHPHPFYYYRMRAASLMHERSLDRYLDPILTVERLLARVPAEFTGARRGLEGILREKRKALHFAQFRFAVREHRYFSAALSLRPSVMQELFVMAKTRLLHSTSKQTDASITPS